jgi:hypothetical protein
VSRSVHTRKFSSRGNDLPENTTQVVRGKAGMDFTWRGNRRWLIDRPLSDAMRGDWRETRRQRVGFLQQSGRLGIHKKSSHKNWNGVAEDALPARAHLTALVSPPCNGCAPLAARPNINNKSPMIDAIDPSLLTQKYCLPFVVLLGAHRFARTLCL